MKRWIAIAVLLTLAAFAQPATVTAADFPKKNITIIVAGSPGGGFDRLARAIGRTMRKYLPEDVHVIVKNITGGGLVIGTVAMYRAKPDGYTLGHLFTDGMLGKQLISGADKTGYDVTKFVNIARVGAEPYSLIVGKNSRFHTLEDLRRAKRVKWGVEGIGVSRWIPTFVTAKELGIHMDVVSGYRGTSEGIPAMIRNDFDVYLQPIDHPTTASYIASGDVRPVLHLHNERPVNAPDTPTAQEKGIDLRLYVGRSIVAPPGLPDDRKKILEDLFMKAMTDPEYKEFLAKSKSPIVPGDSKVAQADLDNYVKTYSRYTQAMRDALPK
ncbi:MAG: tripartite tricarboxylate transporter substrate binding protein [Deltaproteobacteria bacterium]|nr:tripartite tricarboxylate transporter substrate binding protein [Deltaproteobacteria bacterium]